MVQATSLDVAKRALTKVCGAVVVVVEEEEEEEG